jgi:CPA1 family monovalent cation:H+ antiporter
VTGTFALGGALLDFLYAAVVGVAIGLGVAKLCRWAFCATTDGLTHIGITLLSPYIAWVVSESAHASAVLACVAGGLHMRQHISVAVAPSTRIQARAVWDLSFWEAGAGSHGRRVG